MLLSNTFFTRRLRELKEFNKNPNPDKFTLISLIYIWLYSTCLYNEFTVDPLLTDGAWVTLTKHLKEKWEQFPGPLKYHVSRHYLDVASCGLMHWETGLPNMIYKDCIAYTKIIGWKEKHAV